MRFYLLRHGESRGNAEQRIQGRLDLPLTPLGERQAEVAGQWLARLDPPPTVIHASPLIRAHRTAELIAAAFPTPLPVATDLALREMFAGRMEGLTWEEIRLKHPEFYGRPRSQWLNYAPWGGATQNEHFGAAQRYLHQLLEGRDWEDPEPLVLVSHAVTLRALIGGILDEPDHPHLHYHFGNCAIVQCTIRPHSWGLRRTIDALLPIEVIAEALGVSLTNSNEG